MYDTILYIHTLCSNKLIVKLGITIHTQKTSGTTFVYPFVYNESKRIPVYNKKQKT